MAMESDPDGSGGQRSVVRTLERGIWAQPQRRRDPRRPSSLIQLVVRTSNAVLMTSNACAKPRGALARRRALVTTRIAES